MLTHKEVHELFNYNPGTGILTWAKDKGRASKNNEVGWLSKDGYRRTNIRKKSYLIHRIIWLYVYGDWPLEIDHDDRIRDNNRIVNLKDSTHSENMFNRKAYGKIKETGISFRFGKFIVRKTIKGKRYSLGSYSTLELAVKAREEGAKLPNTTEK